MALYHRYLHLLEQVHTLERVLLNYLRFLHKMGILTLQILQNQLVGHASEFSVPGIVHQLEIVQEQIHVFADAVQRFPRRKTAGVHSSMDLLLFTRSEESEQKVSLEQWFSAGEGHASTGLVVEGDVPFDLRHHLRHRHFLAYHFASFGVADLDAGSGENAFLPIGGYHITVPGDGALGADLQAGPAPDALAFPQHQLRRRGLPLGIVTPPATQRTSFEENRGTDTWPVVDGELFYIKNNPCDQNRRL